MDKFENVFMELYRRLRKVTDSKQPKRFRVLRRTGNPLTVLAYVPADWEIGQSTHFPWETRYVALQLPEADGYALKATYLNKPYDDSQAGGLFLFANYTDNEIGYDLLFNHVTTHLVFGIDPVNTESKFPIQ